MPPRQAQQQAKHRILYYGVVKGTFVVVVKIAVQRVYLVINFFAKLGMQWNHSGPIFDGCVKHVQHNAVALRWQLCGGLHQQYPALPRAFPPAIAAPARERRLVGVLQSCIIDFEME